MIDSCLRLQSLESILQQTQVWLQYEFEQKHGRWILKSIKYRPSFHSQYSVCNVLNNGRPLVDTNIIKLNFQTQTNHHFVPFPIAAELHSHNRLRQTEMSHYYQLLWSDNQLTTSDAKLGCCKHPHINLVTYLCPSHSSLNFVYRIT